MCAKFSGDKLPIDGSLGLIFRLNRLWEKVDHAVLDGNYERWELLLDRILDNLLFKEKFVHIHDEEGKIINFKLSDNEEEIFEIAKKKIHRARRAYRHFIVKKDTKKARAAQALIYKSIRLYDISIRKFEQQLKLYLKMPSDNPSTAMFGG